MDELLGESMVRILLTAISGVISILTCIMQMIYGRIQEGTAYAIVTAERPSNGKINFHTTSLTLSSSKSEIAIRDNYAKGKLPIDSY